MTYIDAPLRTYLDDLAAKRPAPGGGSAAALAASVGAGLMSMAAHYTIGRRTDAESSPLAADIMVKVQQYNARLYDLIDADVVAYEKLSRHMKELAERPRQREEAFVEALQPPFEVCKITVECLHLCRDLVSCANPRLITDVAIAALMLEGAFFSAKYNVYANLKEISDVEYVGSIHETLAPLESIVPELKKAIVERCEDVIGR